MDENELIDNGLMVLECPHCGEMVEESEEIELFFSCPNCRESFDYARCQECDSVFGLMWGNEVCPVCGAEI